MLPSAIRLSISAHCSGEKGSTHSGFNLFGVKRRELDFFKWSDVALAILLELRKELLQLLLFARLLVLLIDLAMIGQYLIKTGLNDVIGVYLRWLGKMRRGG